MSPVQVQVSRKGQILTSATREVYNRARHWLLPRLCQKQNTASRPKVTQGMRSQPCPRLPGHVLPHEQPPHRRFYLPLSDGPQRTGRTTSRMTSGASPVLGCILTYTQGHPMAWGRGRLPAQCTQLPSTKPSVPGHRWPHQGHCLVTAPLRATVTANSSTEANALSGATLPMLHLWLDSEPRGTCHLVCGSGCRLGHRHQHGQGEGRTEGTYRGFPATVPLPGPGPGPCRCQEAQACRPKPYLPER